MSDFAMSKTCGECPWRRDVPAGKFPPERYRALQATCEPGGLHPVFACHMTPKGSERACAGFLIAHGERFGVRRNGKKPRRKLPLSPSRWARPIWQTFSVKHAQSRIRNERSCRPLEPGSAGESWLAS